MKQFPHPRKIFTPQTLHHFALVALCFWLPVLLFSGLANEVSERKAIGLDQAILNMIHAFNTPLLDKLALFVTQFGSPIFIVPATLALSAALAYRHRIHQARFVIFAAGGSLVMNLVLKLLFQRERPSLWHTLIAEKSYSFPSGHAMASSALAFTVIALCWSTKWRWLAVAAGSAYFFAVGLTRLYLGVHYPSDVVAGWCVSMIWVLLIFFLSSPKHSLRDLFGFVPGVLPEKA